MREALPALTLRNPGVPVPIVVLEDLSLLRESVSHLLGEFVHLSAECSFPILVVDPTGLAETYLGGLVGLRSPNRAVRRLPPFHHGE